MILKLKILFRFIYIEYICIFLNISILVEVCVLFFYIINILGFKWGIYI